MCLLHSSEIFIIISNSYFPSIPEFNSLTSDDIALVTLSAAIKRSFLSDRPRLLLALLLPLPGKLFVLNADLVPKISNFFAYFVEI